MSSNRFSDKFRRQLRQEAENWRAEALIDQNQYVQLAERYRFSALETAPQSFATILIGLGGLLLGLGAITFVAANWQVMPREYKVVLIMSALIGSNWAGFWCWQRSPQWQRLGQGLLLMGALVMGASIALMGQIFHVDGELYGLFLLWGFGVLAMAYSLRFTPLGITAIILFGLGYLYSSSGYWSGSSFSSEASPAIQLIADLMLAIAVLLLVPLAYWCRSRSIAILAMSLTVLIYVNLLSRPEVAGKNFLIWLILNYMPLIAACLFIPLAYWQRSRSVFVLSVLALLVGMCGSIANLGGFLRSQSLLVALALTLPIALLWAYRDRLYINWYITWRQRFPATEPVLLNQSDRLDLPEFSYLARSLAVIGLSLICYIQSFYATWNWQNNDLKVSDNFQALEWTSLINVLFLTGVTVYSWWHLGRNSPEDRQETQSALTNQAIAGIITVVALVVIWHGSITAIPEVATFIANVLLFMLAIGLIRVSLGRSQRLPFWSGIFLLTLQVISRLFEYETGLLLKSFIFALCGVAIIAAGLWFERYMQTSHSQLNSINSEISNSREDR